MATPLMWQTCLFSNSVYSYLLPYKFPLQIDPSTESFRVEQNHGKLRKFYMSIFIIATVLLSMVSIIFEAQVSRTMNVRFNMLILHVAASFMSAFCLSLLFVFMLFKNEFWNTFLNKFTKFEAKLSSKSTNKEPQVTVSVLNYSILILSGKQFFRPFLAATQFIVFLNKYFDILKYLQKSGSFIKGKNAT